MISLEGAKGRSMNRFDLSVLFFLNRLPIDRLSVLLIRQMSNFPLVRSSDKLTVPGRGMGLG